MYEFCFIEAFDADMPNPQKRQNFQIKCHYGWREMHLLFVIEIVIEY